MPDTLHLAKIETIAAQNDEFRASLPLAADGLLSFSPGLSQLWADSAAIDVFMARCDLIKIVAEFQHSAAPDAKRDFGLFVWREHECCWKIDYFDPKLGERSRNPADPACTRRVLTIMLFSEF